MPTVFISGASGFIALHTIDVLLSKGYTVIGTVRSTEKGDNLVQNFKSKYPDAQISYEIVKDIAADGAFDDALAKHADNLEFVLHTASPFAYGFNKDNEEAYLKPAVNGTTNILKGIKKHAPNVKKVVVTSSFASIANRAADPATFVHTEETWNPITWEIAKDNEVTSYSASKKYAEKAAWAFVEDERPNFTLTTVNPPFVFGPQAFEDTLVNETLNTSAEFVNKLLKTTPADDDSPFDTFGLVVDVRDVALAHVLGLENDKLAGRRVFIVSGKYNTQKVLNVLNDNFPELRGKIAKGKPENAADGEKRAPSYDISETLKLTGLSLIPFEKSVVDAAKQILDYKNKK